VNPSLHLSALLSPAVLVRTETQASDLTMVVALDSGLGFTKMARVEDVEFILSISYMFAG